ncbi:MAG: sigma-70 family RNA polymerase sigma factor [Cellulosimicrobium funkei]
MLEQGDGVREDEERGPDDGWPPEVLLEVDVVARRTRDEEFTAFMREARDPLHRMAYLLCGDRHRAEELTQHALERTYRAWSRAAQRDPLAYARRVLANLRIDTWRRTRREVLAGPDELSSAERAARPVARDGGAGTAAVDDRDAVVCALRALPVRQRRVVVLRHLLDLSENEVAAELVLRRVVPNPAVRDGVRAAPAVPGGRAGANAPAAPRRPGTRGMPLAR